MDKLILQPSETAHWHALINEAQQYCALSLTEDLESYLVFLLMRFAKQPEVAMSILAIEFLDGMQASGGKRQDSLRDLGDKCLLFSGLFPGIATKRRVSPTYFVDMGQSAYSLLADSYDQSALLFASLSEYFENLMDVLKATRHIDNHKLAHLDRVLTEYETDNNFIIKDLTSKYH